MNEKVNKLSCQHIVKLGEIAERVKRNFSTVKRLVSFAVSRTGVTRETIKGWTQLQFIWKGRHPTQMSTKKKLNFNS